MLSLLIFVQLSNSWQLIEELCESASIDQSILPFNWCSKTVERCRWQNITCDLNHELHSLELFNVPLNITLPETIDAPGPVIHTLKMVNCGLKGSVPSTLQQVTTLKILDLSNNKLEGEWPWSMVPFMEEFSVANNRLYGKTYFNSLTYPNQWLNMTRMNIANNLFTEEWEQVVEGYWPAMRYFNIENNQFSGAVPPIRTAFQFRIGGNYFGYFAPTYLQKAPSYNPQTFSDCDMTGVPFREIPPDWMKVYTDRCHYRYDPSNKLYRLGDFTIYPTTTTTARLNSTTTAFAQTTANSTALPQESVFSSNRQVTSSATRAIFGAVLFCFVSLLYDQIV